MHSPRAFRHAGRRLAVLVSLIATLALLPACATLAATTGTTGEQKTAVILVNFQDDTTQAITPTAAHSLVFGQVSDYFWEASYQKTFLSGDTFGWFTLPLTTAQCSWERIVQEGNLAAAAAGANLAGYGQVVYLFPRASGCVSGGGGDIGANGQKLVFVNGEAGFKVQMIAHEMGHGLGLLHSNALDCDATPLGNTCTEIGYGDSADTMGSEGHFNAFQKERLGWLGGAGAPTITTVTASGRYPIQPYETPSTGAKALKILKGTDPATGQKTWYYLEYRQPIGFDSLLADRGNMTTGVMVRTGTISSNGIATSLQLDMTPNTSTWIGVDFEDGALGVGRSFTDAAAGVTISLVSADASGAVIDVSLAATPAPTCTRAAPGLALTGPSTAVAAGSAVAYTLSVTNKDSSACAATTFSLARSVPAGWSGTLGAASLSLSPGTSTTTTLTVASPSTASAGSYGIGAGASSTVGSVHTANAGSSYAVAAGTTSLTEALGTDKTSYLRGETVALSALVKNGGTPTGGARVVFTVTTPGGATTTLSATSGSDGFARAGYRVGKSKAAAGSYGVRAQATLGAATANASATFSAR